MENIYRRTILKYIRNLNLEELAYFIPCSLDYEEKKIYIFYFIFCKMYNNNNWQIMILKFFIIHYINFVFALLHKNCFIKYIFMLNEKEEYKFFIYFYICFFDREFYNNIYIL